MADLVGYVVTPTGTATKVVDTATIQLQVRDSKTNALIADFTGASALHWPDDLTNLTAAQKLVLLDRIIRDIIALKSGQA